MTSPQRFSLLYGEQPEENNQDRTVDHAAFRRPDPVTAPPVPPADTPDAPAQQASTSEPEKPSDDTSQGWTANALNRVRVGNLSASSQPVPLVSVLPSSVSAEEEEPHAAPAPMRKDAPVVVSPKDSPSSPRKPEVLQPQTPTAPSARKNAPASEAHDARSGKRTTFIIGAIVLLLVGMVCADRYFMPMVHYREALQQEADGNYDQAARLYAALGDYRDSPDRAAQLPAKKIIAMMNEGKYQEALDQMEAENKDDPLIADCLYALGVLVYNDGDPEAGLGYVAKLKARFPDYAGTRVLEQYCNYSLGLRYAELAASLKDYSMRNDNLELAYKYFDAAGNYGDAADKAMDYRYLLFSSLQKLGTDRTVIQKAVTLLEEMGDYRNAPEARLRLMYDYVLSHYIQKDDFMQEDSYYRLIKDDDLLNTYLEELTAINYVDARAIQDRLNAKGFSMELTYGDDTTPLPEVVTDLSQVYLHYEIPNWENLAPVNAILFIAYPERGETSEGYLDAGGASGTFRLDLAFNEYNMPYQDEEIIVAVLDGRAPDYIFDSGDEAIDVLRTPCVACFRYGGG